MKRPQHEEIKMSNLKEMLNREKTMMDSASGFWHESDTTAFNSIWREKVAEWSYNVIDRLGESRSIVYIAMNIMDRFLAFKCKSANADCFNEESLFELLAVTSLVLALKICSNSKSKAHYVVKLARSNVQLKDVIKMGKEIANCLSWKYQISAPARFLRPIIDQALFMGEDDREKVLQHACYLSEVAVCESYVIGIAPSTVALAAVVASMDVVNGIRVTDEQKRNFIDSLEFISSTRGELLGFILKLRKTFSQSQESVQEGSSNFVPLNNDAMVSTPTRSAMKRVVSSDNLACMQSLNSSRKRKVSEDLENERVKHRKF